MMASGWGSVANCVRDGMLQNLDATGVLGTNGLEVVTEKIVGQRCCHGVYQSMSTDATRRQTSSKTLVEPRKVSA